MQLSNVILPALMPNNFLMKSSTFIGHLVKQYSFYKLDEIGNDVSIGIRGFIT